uniref:SCAN domain-containing protein 3-like n=1 Tax=Myxine glutinosa TaxID=7769 RepID=UPI00358ED13F
MIAQPPAGEFLHPLCIPMSKQQYGLGNLAWNIARAKKPYSEGEFVKTCLRDVIAILTPENDSLKRSVSDLQLSRHTVEQRISDVNNSIETQLHTDLEKCRYFSIVLDESCDIQDKPQLAIFVRSVSEDCTIKEELLDIVPLKDRTRGIDLKETLTNFVEKANLQLPKLTAISTDGAPAMLGSANGLAGLCKADERFPDFRTFHCIIHQENLVSKKLNLDHVMKPVLEIVNFFRTHALKHRQFKNLIAELDEDLSNDLLLHCTTHLQKGELTHFPSELKANGEAAEVTKRSIAHYATLVENLQQSFEDRFCNLKKQRPQITFLINPFTAESDCLKAPIVADEAASQLEMIELSEDDRLKYVLREGTIGTEFWKIVPTDRYPSVKQAALKLMSMFGSTYVCESVFSPLKQVKSRHRSVLTDTHVKELLRVATTEYKPDLKMIVENKDCQVSH